MYIIHTDENNYVTSLELNPKGVEVADVIKKRKEARKEIQELER